MTQQADARRYETRNLMTALSELAQGQRDKDANAVRWAIADLATLAVLGTAPNVRHRAIAELCHIGFWNNCQPEPVAAKGV